MMKNHSRATVRERSIERKLKLVRRAERERSPVTKRIGTRARRKRAILPRSWPRKRVKSRLAIERRLNDWKAAAGATKKRRPTLNRQRRREAKMRRKGPKAKTTAKNSP